ncbi:MAG: site-2 protease family protein [Candidatus Moraniibacteriota bacterium]
MSNEIVLIGFYFLTLLYSVIIHEVSHGVVALWLGDITAKYTGRITLNPISHIDPIGSILIPILLIPTGFAFGYAKPVPYNPHNLRDQKWGPLQVALAGPATNFISAFAAALFATLVPLASPDKLEIYRSFSRVIGGGGGFLDRFGDLASVMVGSLPSIFFGLLLFVVFWNVVLGCFNLLPIPPLDGSKILFTFFPVSEQTQRQLEQYGFFVLLFIIFLFPAPISAFISFFLNLFFGLIL